MNTLETGEMQEPGGGDNLSAAQRARIERQRIRARALRDARLTERPQFGDSVTASRAPFDTGGGFLLEPQEDEEVATRLTVPPGPVPHHIEQPRCLTCGINFPQSYLFDTFNYSVCDTCKVEEGGAHSLITRTEAKSEYLLQDCDLDVRPPPLRCVRRRNPHRARFAEMRLYLRAQVEERALLVWGSAEALEAERERRAERAEKARVTAERRRLRALRMNVRSSLYDRTSAAHEHSYGPERYDPKEDVYSRECTSCHHIQTYEKM